MNPTNKEAWEEEFEKLWEFSFENEKGTSPKHNCINFIRSLIKTERQKEREEVLKWAHTGGGCGGCTIYKHPDNMLGSSGSITKGGGSGS